MTVKNRSISTQFSHENKTLFHLSHHSHWWSLTPTSFDRWLNDCITAVFVFLWFNTRTLYASFFVQPRSTLHRWTSFVEDSQQWKSKNPKQKCLNKSTKQVWFLTPATSADRRREIGRLSHVFLGKFYRSFWPLSKNNFIFRHPRGYVTSRPRITPAYHRSISGAKNIQPKLLIYLLSII